MPRDFDNDSKRSVKFPPKLTSDPTKFRDWLEEVAVWRISTDVPDEKKSVRLYSVLPRDIQRMIGSQINMPRDLAMIRTYDTILDFLKDRFLKGSNSTSFVRYRKLMMKPERSYGCYTEFLSDYEIRYNDYLSVSNFTQRTETLHRVRAMENGNPVFDDDNNEVFIMEQRWEDHEVQVEIPEILQIYMIIHQLNLTREQVSEIFTRLGGDIGTWRLWDLKDMLKGLDAMHDQLSLRETTGWALDRQRSRLDRGRYADADEDDDVSRNSDDESGYFVGRSSNRRQPRSPRARKGDRSPRGSRRRSTSRDDGGTTRWGKGRSKGGMRRRSISADRNRDGRNGRRDRPIRRTRDRSSDSYAADGKGSGTCFGCGSDKHMLRECTKVKNLEKRKKLWKKMFNEAKVNLAEEVDHPKDKKETEEEEESEFDDSYEDYEQEHENGQTKSSGLMARAFVPEDDDSTEDFH
ncbi:MAG: hypothetical protein CMA61_00385 [Euryarchaeota archaeon]|nr:hypothetical protein [Euryarchaeota archaeon]